MKDLPFTHPQFFQIYLTEDMNFPQVYMSTKNEKETSRELFNKYFHLSFDWMKVDLSGFRRLNQNEVEVVYSAYMPEVLGANKSGQFFSEQALTEFNIEIDSYYEELLSRRSRSQ